MPTTRQGTRATVSASRTGSVPTLMEHEKDLRAGQLGQEQGSGGRVEGRPLPLQSDFHGGSSWVVFVTCCHPLGSPVTHAPV